MEETNEISIVSSEVLMDKYASEYMDYKRNAASSLIFMGKILYDLKDKVAHGHWLDFLDNKVKESKRTAQRYITIYKEYGHFIPNKEAFKAICELGTAHLNELRKLPDAFKKEITIVRLDDDKNEHPKTVSVLDEEKVVDFLNEVSESKNGEDKLIKDMTSEEIAEKVREAQGIFAPTKASMDGEMSLDEGASEVFNRPLHETDEDKPLTPSQEYSNNIVMECRNIVKEVFKEAEDASDNLCLLNKDLFELKDNAEHIMSLDMEMRKKLKRKMFKVKSDAEALMVHATDLIDRL